MLPEPERLAGAAAGCAACHLRSVCAGASAVSPGDWLMRIPLWCHSIHSSASAVSRHIPGGMLLDVAAIQVATLQCLAECAAPTGQQQHSQSRTIPSRRNLAYHTVPYPIRIQLS